MTAVPHDGAQKSEVGGWERSAIHRHRSGSSRASVRIIHIDEIELRTLRNVDVDPDQAARQQQAEGVPASLKRRDVGARTVRPIIDAEDRIETAGRVESFAELARCHTPPLRRAMTGRAASSVGAEILEEGVGAIECPRSDDRTMSS